MVINYIGNLPKATTNKVIQSGIWKNITNKEESNVKKRSSNSQESKKKIEEWETKGQIENKYQMAELKL